MVIYFALTYNGKYGGIIKFPKNFAGLTLHNYNTNVSSLILPFQCSKGSNGRLLAAWLRMDIKIRQYAVNIKHFLPNVYKSFETKFTICSTGQTVWI